MSVEAGLSRALIDVIEREILRQPGAKIQIDTPLVSSGLVDSFAMLDLIHALEDLCQVELDPGRLQPRDLETVETMLAAVQRLGRPIEGGDIR